MNSVLSVGLLLVLTPLASAKSFLESGTETETEVIDMLTYLLSKEQGSTHPVLDPEHVELKAAVLDQHEKDSHAKHQVGLESMFKALPKNENGNIGLPAARYALHRLFEERHRWFVRGLHPNAESKGKASSHVVGKALEMLEAADHKGLTIAGLAAIAGTLEQLIDKEAAAQLDYFFRHNKQPVEGTISGKTLSDIIESYMTIYISGADFKKTTKKDISEDNQFMLDHTREWKETKDWVQSTAMWAIKTDGGCKDSEHHANAQLSDCQVHFNDSARMLKAVIGKYGFFNDNECHRVKDKLLEMQEHRSGRVTLANFYKAGMSGAWDFNEKVDYLRSLGALDESVKDSPQVIVPNYVSSWVNCLSPSKFYSVCCRNECEDHMRVIEQHVPGATADPDKIIQLVETLPAFAADKPPNMAALRHRLVSVAERHRGKVPIHGRLFAQWMHHAFPSTCPYPHEAGTTNPQTPDEWMVETGHTNIKASEDEKHKVMKSQSISVSVEGVSPQKPMQAGELPWSDVEELLVVRPAPQTEASNKNFAEQIIYFMEAVLVVVLVCVIIWIASEQRKARLVRNKGHV